VHKLNSDAHQVLAQSKSNINAVKTAGQEIPQAPPLPPVSMLFGHPECEIKSTFWQVIKLALSQLKSVRAPATAPSFVRDLRAAGCPEPSNAEKGSRPCNETGQLQAQTRRPDEMTGEQLPLPFGKPKECAPNEDVDGDWKISSKIGDKVVNQNESKNCIKRNLDLEHSAFDQELDERQFTAWKAHEPSHRKTVHYDIREIHIMESVHVEKDERKILPFHRTHRRGLCDQRSTRSQSTTMPI